MVACLALLVVCNFSVNPCPCICIIPYFTCGCDLRILCCVLGLFLDALCALVVAACISLLGRKRRYVSLSLSNCCSCPRALGVTDGDGVEIDGCGIAAAVHTTASVFEINTKNSNIGYPWDL